VSYTFYITPSAYADIKVAVDYYNSRSNGLGSRMAIEIDQMLEKIALNPLIFSVRHRHVRAAKLPSFPFLIFYKINNKAKSIQVLRVFNTYMKPFWTR